MNEYAHDLSDKDLKGLIVQVTGLTETDSVVRQTFSTLKELKEKANFEKPIDDAAGSGGEGNGGGGAGTGTGGGGGGSGGKALPLNIGYTINLNLPATKNVEVFNAIFKSLKEHLLQDE